MPKRRPPIELAPTGGRAGDIPPPGAGPPPRPAGEHPAWRLLRGLLATVTWVAMATLLVTGIWLWLEYVPVPDLPAGADPASTLTAHQYDVYRMQGVHVLATWALGLAGGLWLSAIAATSPTSRRVVATGALLALLGGGAAVWTGTLLPWSDAALGAITPGDERFGQRGLLLDQAVRSYLVDGREVDSGTLEGLAWGHVLAAALVVVGVATAAGLARARRRRPDDDAMPATRGGPRSPGRITLPADVEAPDGWSSRTGPSAGPTDGDQP